MKPLNKSSQNQTSATPQDIRASLTNLYGMACFMHEEPLTDAQRSYLDCILKAAEYLLSLVEEPLQCKPAPLSRRNTLRPSTSLRYHGHKHDTH